ncbi:MAG: hypothetical protein MZV64_26570 [Ignavibacteriales bacterium]|nr:hypothetical protein [Ignavibacteriales bacterium]
MEGKVTLQDIQKLQKGIEIEKGKIAYAEAIIINAEKSETILQITLYQGYYRQIRRMMKIIEHPVVSLKRVSHANMTLSGLDRGEYRFLKGQEVSDLYNYLKKIIPAEKTSK